MTAPVRSMRYTASRVANVGAVTWRSPEGAIPRWNAATLGGRATNGDTSPDGVTLKIVPDRSPTNKLPVSSKAKPQATPSSAANCFRCPSASTRNTAPSKRLDTNRRPSGSRAREVGFVMPVTNGSRNPSRRSRNTDTGADSPRVPL